MRRHEKWTVVVMLNWATIRQISAHRWEVQMHRRAYEGAPEDPFLGQCRTVRTKARAETIARRRIEWMNRRDQYGEVIYRIIA